MDALNVAGLATNQKTGENAPNSCDSGYIKTAKVELSGGPLWEGMFWLMIFGLLVATLLTLYVVPALYAILVETFGVKPISAEN